MKLPSHVSDAVRKRNPEVFEAGATRLRPAEREQPQKRPLARQVKRVKKGGMVPPRRARVLFTVYSQRPVDWDNAYTKPLQDLLIKAGLLDGDEWDILEGSVRSEKAWSKEEERTEVEIIKP